MSSYDDSVPTGVASPAGGPSAEAPEQEREQPRLRAALVEIVQTVLLTLLIFFAVRSVVQNFRVEGASMEATLHTGEYLLISKADYFHVDGTPLAFLGHRNASDPEGPLWLFGGPQRGDIVVFEAPGGNDRDFIKRIIGLPGETVEVKHGVVYINGKELDEPYLVHHATYDFEERTIPEGNYFVLGDNRPNSSDSHLGWFVPTDTIIGKAWLSYQPPASWGAVTH